MKLIKLNTRFHQIFEKSIKKCNQVHDLVEDISRLRALDVSLKQIILEETKRIIHGVTKDIVEATKVKDKVIIKKNVMLKIMRMLGTNICTTKFFDYA